MKRLTLLIIMILLTFTTTAYSDIYFNNNGKFFHQKVMVTSCVYRNYICETKVGKYRYCVNMKSRSGVNIDCKIYDEAKKLMNQR